MGRDRGVRLIPRTGETEGDGRVGPTEGRRRTRPVGTVDRDTAPDRSRIGERGAHAANRDHRRHPAREEAGTAAAAAAAGTPLPHRRRERYSRQQRGSRHPARMGRGGPAAGDPDRRGGGDHAQLRPARDVDLPLHAPVGAPVRPLQPGHPRRAGAQRRRRRAARLARPVLPAREPRRHPRRVRRQHRRQLAVDLERANAWNRYCSPWSVSSRSC